MAASNSIDDVFKEAHQRFLKSLSADEASLYSTCSSAEQLLKGAQKLEAVAKDRVRGRGFVSRIKQLSDRLSPYFEVVSITVQSNPEYAALAWGAIRLVLQLASNYTGFFDKLTRVLECLALQLPQNDLIQRITESPRKDVYGDKIRNTLCNVYVDLFNFLHGVARIFTSKKGKNKHRPEVMANLAFTPFDVRFKDILERMEMHRKILLEILQLEHIHSQMEGTQQILDELDQKDLQQQYEETNEHFVRLERQIAAMSSTEQSVQKLKTEMMEAHKAATISRIRDWLSPPEFEEEYNRAHKTRLDGTADWIFEDPAFNEWKESPLEPSAPEKFGPECFWVQGNPGFGKTILAATVVADFKETMGKDIDTDVLYFFFRSTTSTMNSTSAAFRSILAQILQANREDESVTDRFVFSMMEASGGQITASSNDVSDLLRVYAKSCRTCLIVLDGIDECGDHPVLVEELLELKREPSIKLLLFSRPTVPSLYQTVIKDHTLMIGRQTSQDIHSYLSKELDRLQKRRLLPLNADAQKLVSHLNIGSDGMFLWARLMITYLNSPALTRTQRIQVIENVTLPEGLEFMYDRISNLIGEGYEVERSLARRIIMWLAFSMRRLTVQEIREVVAPVETEEEQSETSEEEFIETAIMVCAGLIESEEIYSPLHGRTARFLRFIHLSARDYFSHQEDLAISVDKNSFLSTMRMSHAEMTRDCLDAITYGLPAHPLGGSLGHKASSYDFMRSFPFCSYAALHWVEHLQFAQAEVSTNHARQDTSTQDQLDQLFSSLLQFVSQSFVLMSWIEANYVCGHAPPSQTLETWSKWAKPLPFSQAVDVQKLCEDIAELSRYLRELDGYWGSKLAANPECIWEEVTAFTPCRLLAQTKAVKVHTFTSEEPMSESVSTKCLCKISRTSPNGLLISILSIWPSSKYEEFTQHAPKTIPLRSLRTISSGWVARYELWSLVDNPTPIVDHRFPLPQSEVWLQMKQSMCEAVSSEHSGGWGMQFPMAIGTNVRMFTVLRTLFYLQPAVSEPGLILNSTVFDLALDGQLSNHWVPDYGLTGSDSTISLRDLAMDRRFERGDLFLYWFSFHPDDQSILFVGQDSKAPSLAVVFKIKTSSKPVTSIFNHAKLNIEKRVHMHPEWSGRFNQVKVIHHPLVSLLGFSFASQLYLWPFTNPAAKPSSLCSTHPNPTVAFSDCGKYVVYSEPQEGRRVKRPIPHELIQSQHLAVRSSQALPGLNSRDPSPSRLAQNLAIRSGPRSPSPNSAGGPWTKSTQWRPSTPSDLAIARRNAPMNVMNRQGHKGVHAFVADNSVQIQIPKKDQQAEYSRELYKLPSWANDEPVDVALHVPEKTEERVQVVLNKAAEPWYGMSPSQDTHLPIVIHGDRRALNMPDHLSIEDSGLKPSIGPGVLGGDLYDQPQALATEFLELYRKCDVRKDFELAALAPYEDLAGRLARWMRGGDGSVEDAMLDGMFRLLLATGKGSSDSRTKAAACAVLEFRNAMVKSELR